MRIDLKDGRYIKVNIEMNEKGVYEYYTDGILIGVYAPNTMKDSKFLKIDLERNNTIDNELSAEIKDNIRQVIDEVKDNIEQIDIKDIDAEAKENKALDGYMREIGVDRERVRNIVVMDLEREKKKEKRNNKEKEEKEKESQKKSAKEQMKSNNPNTSTPKVTKKDVNIKQEIGLGERANDVQDFKRWIGGKLPDDIQKIGVIESDEMSKMKDDKGRVIDNSSTRFALVVIGKDGRVEPLKKYIPQLEQNHSSGNNPIKTQYQINTNGEVEKDAVLSEYRIGNKIIQLDKDQGDNLEVNIGKYSPNTNDLVSTEMRGNQTTFATDTETRKAAMGHYKGVYNSENSYKEAEKHNENNPDCDKMDEKDIDGDPNTKSHIHDENLNFNELAVKWGLINNGRPDAEKARQVYEKEANNNLEKSQEEIIEMVSEEMENDYRPMNMAQ